MTVARGIHLACQLAIPVSVSVFGLKILSPPRAPTAETNDARTPSFNKTSMKPYSTTVYLVSRSRAPLLFVAQCSSQP